MCLTDEQVEMLVRFRNHEPSVALSNLASATVEASPVSIEGFVTVGRRFFASLRTTKRRLVSDTAVPQLAREA